MGISQPLIQSALLGEALDAGPVLVFVADETMTYAAVNRRACEALGYTREQLLALSVSDVATHDTARAEFAEMVSSGSRRGECMLRRADGTSVPFRYVASETRIAGLRYFVSVGVVDAE